MSRFPQPSGPPIASQHLGRAYWTVVVVAWKTQDFFADSQDAMAIQAR